MKVEKYLEDKLRDWTDNVRFGNAGSEGRELAEYYRDGLMQYRMLHSPELTFLVPRLSLLFGVDLRKVLAPEK